jgi:hypothetical protein
MSDRAVAFCAALGMSSHCMMSHGSPYDQDAAYIKPLWDVRGSLPGGAVAIHNPTCQPVEGITATDDRLFPLVYLNEKGQALLVVTNLADKPISGSVDLDLRALNITGEKIKPLNFDRVAECTAGSGGIRFQNLPNEKFCAALIL